MAAVEGSLQRLQTDYLDILLLHLPDALMEPDEIAKAFDDLNSAGKARYFGVSNYSGDQIDLLATYIGRPIVVNQIHVSLGRTSPVADGQEFTLNISKDTTRDHDYSGVAGPGTLDYCRKHGIQVQAWSPLRGDLLDPQPHAAPEVKRTASALKELAQQKDVTPSAIALAWLMRHPVGIVPLIGATTASHIVDNCAADGVTLSSQEWYRLFAAAAPLESRFI
jgi:predicted oxidoreductase